jgi:transmembrane sensor
MSEDLEAPYDIDAVLLARFLSDECSRSERDAVQEWMAADPVHRARVEALRAVWASAGTSRVQLDLDATWAAVTARVAHSGRRPALRVVPPRVRRAESGARWWISVGAVAAVLTVAAVGVLRYAVPGGVSARTPETMREVATAAGQRATVQLGDGTRVVLGVDSKLRFPAAFGGARREVYLDGEGYFDVTHDAAKPFVVHVRDAVAEDLGTAFGVRAYEDDSTVQVVVTAGKVALGAALPGAPRGPVLTAGRLGRLDRRSHHVEVQSVDTTAYLAWRDGRLVFDNTPLPQVVAELHRWYDVDIQVADSNIAARQLTASFHARSITEILDFMTLAMELRYERHGRTVTLFPDNAR